MKREMAVYTHDNSYAYKFRNKLSYLECELEYINCLEDLDNYIHEKEMGIIFIDSNCGELESLEFLIRLHSKNFVFVYIEDVVNSKDESYANCEKIHTTMDNIEHDIFKICELSDQKCNSRNRINSAKIYNSIPEALLAFGLSPKRIGYKYLQDCLELCMNFNKKSFICFKLDIYPQISEIYNVSMGAVEKAIRSSLKEAYSKFPELFNNDSFKLVHPTNNQFINFLIERIK